MVKNHTVPTKVCHPSAFLPKLGEPDPGLWLRLWGMSSVQIKNQDPISHRLHVSHEETKHLFHKIWKLKKSPSDCANTCLCLYYCCQEKNRTCLNEAARSWTVFSLYSREVRGFFVSLHGNVTLLSKKPKPISVAFLSTIVPTTQEKSRWASAYWPWDKNLHLIAVEVHQLTPTCASKYQPHAPTWAHGCCRARCHMGPMCEGLLGIWCSASLEVPVKEISCNSHIEISG